MILMSKIKAYLGIFARVAVRALCRIFYIFPIKKNRVIFWSFNKAEHYNCNPKYICEYLKKVYPAKFELVWALSDLKRRDEVDGAIVVRYRSIKWFYYVLTSGVIVINRAPDSFLPKRKGQYVINTWHAGGAYKRVGYENTMLNSVEKWTRKRLNEYTDLFVSSSEAFTKSNIQGYHYSGEILKCGMPRNDIFFHPDEYDRVRTNIRSKLGLENAFAILYAPTFRGRINNPNGRSSNVVWNEIKENNKVLRFLIRQHQNDTNSYENNDNVQDLSEYPDMQELLCACDMLITDYSSSIWDFALTRKPCLLYVPDLNAYTENDRGFFTPIEKWPGIICRNMEELCAFIENMDEKKCAEIAEEHLRYMNSYENGHACEAVCAKILEHTQKLVNGK
jgi:CDP-glycerol glycerophosphotransferase